VTMPTRAQQLGLLVLLAAMAAWVLWTIAR
jgi:hypothetical protein